MRDSGRVRWIALVLMAPWIAIACSIPDEVAESDDQDFSPCTVGQVLERGQGCSYARSRLIFVNSAAELCDGYDSDAGCSSMGPLDTRQIEGINQGLDYLIVIQATFDESHAITKLGSEELTGELLEEAIHGSADDSPYVPLDSLVIEHGPVLVQLGSLNIMTPRACISISNTRIRGTIISIFYSKWQRRASSTDEWEDVPGSREKGAICGPSGELLTESETGQYRLVARMRNGDKIGNFSSNILTR